MSEQAFAAITGRAADAVSRRSSLATLGGAALAAGLLAPLAAGAKDNKAKKAKKKARKKCRQQQGQCEEAVREICSPVNAMATESVRAEGNGPSTCVQRLSSCCPFFATCNAREGVECLFQQRP